MSKNSKFWNVYFWKTKTCFWCRMTPGFQWCHLFFCTWSRTPQKSCLIVWRHHYPSCCRKKFSFWGQKSRYRFEILSCSGALARCLTYNTVFWKFSKFLILWLFLFIQKQKRYFLNFGGQNHEISKIRDSRLVELVILRLTCVLYAFTFNSLPFMDSQTIATFGSKIACSDVTKTLIAPKFSVRYFWNFVRRWSIQFVTASRSLARLRRAKPEL